MDPFEKDPAVEKERPPCFGNEAKFAGHLEAENPDSECARCPSENDCGELILFRCSRELMF